MCSDVGTEVVVETGLAFDFGPMAPSIRWLFFDAWRDRGDLGVEQHHGQLDGSRSRQSKTELTTRTPTAKRIGTPTPEHDGAMAAPTPRRMAPRTPQHDAARREPRIESSKYIIYHMLYFRFDARSGISGGDQEGMGV